MLGPCAPQGGNYVRCPVLQSAAASDSQGRRLRIHALLADAISKVCRPEYFPMRGVGSRSLLDQYLDDIRIVVRDDDPNDASILRRRFDDDGSRWSTPLVREQRADQLPSGLTVLQFHLIAGRQWRVDAKVLHDGPLSDIRRGRDVSGSRLSRRSVDHLDAVPDPYIEREPLERRHLQ